MIDRDTIDRIYAAANIVDIVGDFVTLKRKGVNYQACCPFHNEKTPSFVVSPSKGVYKCFGCGKGGNAITFLMEHESITYPEALKIVAKRYGIDVVEKELSPEEERRNDDRESMFALNSWAQEYFVNYLHNDEEGVSVGLSYFKQARKMSMPTIKKFGLGFCPAQGRKLSEAAKAAGYQEQFLVSTGLSLKRESDGAIYDRFRDRVMFPIHNISGRIVGFGGRTLRTDKNVAKYQNSPESEIYSKKRELYGLYFAKKAIQQHDYAIMVEGYTDVISMHQSGVENVVSSSGTSLTIEQIRLLHRFTKNITMIYDGDSAGIRAALRGVDMILSEGLNVRIVLLPEGEDPDSFARSRSAEQVQDYIRTHEEDFIAFKAKMLLKDTNGDPIKRAETVNDMVQSIVNIPDSIQRSIFIKECARIMDIDEQLLISEVARKRLATTGDRETDDFIRRQTMRQRETPQRVDVVDPTQSVAGGSSLESLERELTKYLLKYGHKSFDFREGPQIVEHNVADVIFAELEMDSLTFDNSSFQAILATYKEQWQAMGVGQEIPAHLFINHPDPVVCNVAVDLLTDEDNYIPSGIWLEKDKYIDVEGEMLSAGVPKAVTLYKSKVIDRLIVELNHQLADKSKSEEEQMQILMRLSNMLKAKNVLARKLERVII